MTRHSMVTIGSVNADPLPLEPACDDRSYAEIALNYGLLDQWDTNCVLCLAIAGERFTDYEEFRRHQKHVNAELCNGKRTRRKP